MGRAIAADLRLAGHERIASERNQFCGEMHPKLPLDGAARIPGRTCEFQGLRQEIEPYVDIRTLLPDA